LFVVGAILSNKVLDDHVFTLKTWHEVSGIPLSILNRLEWLSLDLLSHDLYVCPSVWQGWLRNIHSYHGSSQSRVMGSKEKTTDALVRFMLDRLLDVHSPPHAFTEPVFLGLNDRINDKAAAQRIAEEGPSHLFELDEDGPLREEYLPRRRSSAAFSGESLPYLQVHNGYHGDNNEIFSRGNSSFGDLATVPSLTQLPSPFSPIHPFLENPYALESGVQSNLWFHPTTTSDSYIPYSSIRTLKHGSTTVDYRSTLCPAA